MSEQVCPSCGHGNSTSRVTCKVCRQTLARDVGPNATSDADNPSLSTLSRSQSAPNPPIRGDDYAVVPFIGKTGGAFSSINAMDVSVQLASVINAHAAQGWEFVTVAKVDIQVNPGCIGVLLGAKASFITFDQVIFRRVVEQ